MKANRGVYPVFTMCCLLGVSSSGYHARKNRPLSMQRMADAVLMERIRAIHSGSRQTYGMSRVHFELTQKGFRIGRKRVARLMRAAGLQGISRSKGIRTTIRGKEAQAIPDPVKRNFLATTPNRLWVADITYIPTLAGFLYLAVVMEAFPRRIVGRAMETHLRTELVLETLNMALWQRRPSAVIHRSDQGCQYTSIAFGKPCKEAEVWPSTGTVGDCFDNALYESFFATLECELFDRYRFKTQAEARMAVFEFIETC